MAPQGKALYYNALLAGSFGFLTFGWDAGVLGGILLTPEFLASVGVCGHSTPQQSYVLTLTISTESNERVQDFHDHVDIPVGVMAGLHDHHILRNAHGQKVMDLGWQCRRACRHHHLCFVLQLWTIE